MKLVLLLAAGAFAAQDVTPPVISLTFAKWVGEQYDVTDPHPNQHTWHTKPDGTNHDGSDPLPESADHALPGWYTEEMSKRSPEQQVSKRASVTCIVDKTNMNADTTACPDPKCTASDHHDSSVDCDEPRVIQISKSAANNGNHAQKYNAQNYVDAHKNAHWRKIYDEAGYESWGDDRISLGTNYNRPLVDAEGNPVEHAQAHGCTANADTTCVKRSQLGQYLVTYTASDDSGNKAEPIAFTFIFIDPIVPKFEFEAPSATSNQAHGSTGYTDDMKTWPKWFEVESDVAGAAVWDSSDRDVVDTTNTFGHIVSEFATTKADANTHIVPDPQITGWGNQGTAGSDITDYTAFATGQTPHQTNFLANVEAGRCNKLYGGAQNRDVKNVPVKCGRTGTNGNWADYVLDVTVSDNYREPASIKVFSRISVSTSTPSTSWEEHTTSSKTTTLCMAAKKEITIDWYADDEAGIFGWKHKSNPQAHRVQITVSDNTRPTIHPLNDADDPLRKVQKDSTTATTYSAADGQAKVAGAYAGTWSTDGDNAGYYCKGFSDDCANAGSLADCVELRDSGCVWTRTLAMETSDCDVKPQAQCNGLCKWHSYSTLTWADGLHYSGPWGKCRSTSENQVHIQASHETSDFIQCGHNDAGVIEPYVERGFEVHDNQDGMDGDCDGWKRVKCEFATAAHDSVQTTGTKTADGFAATTGSCRVDNTALWTANPTADLGGANQLPSASEAAFAADYTVTYDYMDSNKNVAAPVTRRVVVVDTVPPTLTLQGDCVIQNSAGAHYNSTADQDTIAETKPGDLEDGGSYGLFDHDRIARFFSHRDDCDRKVHTIVTLHSGGCDWTNTGGVADGNVNCHGQAENQDSKLGCSGGDSTNSNCFLGVFEWNGDEQAQSAASDTFNDLMGTTKNQYHQEFHEYIAGEYAVQYKTMDASGNFVTACRKIQNVDHTYPIIQILGSDQMTLEATHQGNYIDDGATCSDQVDGVISQNVEVSGDVVNLSKVGTYTITYNCKDSANNAAPAAQRTVVVAQTSCPKCTIHGATEIQHEASFPYSDAGASCSDVIDGDVTTLCFSASYTVQTTNEDGTIETHEAGVDKPAPAQSKPDGGRFDGGATWGGLGYCDEMEGTINTACKDFDQDACLATTTCKWNIYKECSTAAAGALDKKNLIDDTAASGTSSTHDGAQIGTYFITYRAKNTVGLYNDGPNCRGGAAEYVRTVKVMDTLRPVITLKYDSGSGSATVAQGELSPTTSTTSDLTLTDTLSDKLYPSVTDAPYQSKGHFADSYGGNHEDQMMAEESTSSVNGWVIGAIASAVAGLALLGYSTRRTAVATSVPV